MHAPSIAILFLAISGAYASTSTHDVRVDEQPTPNVHAHHAKITTTPEQSSLLSSFADKMNLYTTLTKINPLLDKVRDQYMSTQTAFPDGVEDTRYYYLYDAGGIDALASAVATQTIVVGAAKESYASDAAAYASVFDEIATSVRSILAAETSSASGTSATGTSATGTSASGTASVTGSAGSKNGTGAAVQESSTSALGLNGMFVAVLAGVLALAVTF